MGVSRQQEIRSLSRDTTQVNLSSRFIKNKCPTFRPLILNSNRQSTSVPFIPVKRHSVAEAPSMGQALINKRYSHKLTKDSFYRDKWSMNNSRENFYANREAIL